MDKVIWLDCETGGLEPALHDITQIAGIIEIKGVIQEEFEIRMRPSDPSRVSAEALAITGQTLEEVMAHKFTQRAGYEHLLGYLGAYCNKFDKADKFVWAGQNAPFDVRFVRHLFTRMGDKYFGSWFYPMPADLISFAMAMRMRGYLPDIKNMKLATICEALNVPLEAHKAIEDVRATRACFMKLAEIVPSASLV